MRKALEDLIFIGDIKETYRLFGKDWTLKTLTMDDQLKATSSTRDYDNVSRLNALKVALIARSLIEVNNNELKDLSEKIDFLGKLQQPLVDLLYEKYTDLQSKQDEALKLMNEEGNDDIKK